MPACRGHPPSQMLRRTGRPRLQLDAHIKARFAEDDKQNSPNREFYFTGTPSANCGASWLIGLDLAGSAAPFMEIASS